MPTTETEKKPPIVVIKKIPLNKIYNGTKHTRLYLLSFNRPIASVHVREIAESIKDHGWLGTIKCVRTKLFSPNKAEQIYIVDGQHSWHAAAMVNSDFRYEVRDVNSRAEIITLMADLNNNSKGWFLHDYLNVWARDDRHAYKVMEKIIENTGFPLAPLINIYSSNLFGSGGKTTQKFKRGNLELKNKKLADEIVDELVLMRPILTNIKDNFILAFADLYARQTYHRKAFLAKLEKDKAMIKILTTIPDIKEVLTKFMKRA